MMRSIAVLGSTGSIGRNTLALVDLHPDRFRVAALAALRNSELLLGQCLKYRPLVVALYDREAARQLSSRVPGVRVVAGPEGVAEAACLAEVDVVLSAITGAAGLLPTFEAARAGKHVALANKESLVMAGDLLMPMFGQNGNRLIPVDSEHSALHQCLRAASMNEVRRLVLTASGGPFLGKTPEELERVTAQEALKHPTWQMGPKITVDSATLMNKGLEVIEAHHLFGFSAERISVVVHPQSIVHSLVEFVDGAYIAQLSITDMRLPILYALAYPERCESGLPSLDLPTLPALEFAAPQADRFPCLRLAYEALRAGNTYPAVLNASNEVAVDLFLKEEIPFTGIPRIIETVLSGHNPQPLRELETVFEVDAAARVAAHRAGSVLAEG